jgi:hypothetical protein
VTWPPGITPQALDNTLTVNNARLVSLSLSAFNPRRFAALWIPKGKDDGDAGWNQGISASSRAALDPHTLNV